MAYILYKTNGQKLVTIPDGSLDKNTADLTFLGKNYAGYGEIINQNFVKLLENFANVAEPTKPLLGQLWYDTTNKRIKFYDGLRFKPVGTIDVASSTPRFNTKGDLWFNEFEQKLYFYNGSKFVLIGPFESQFSGISVVPAVANTDNDLQKYVMKFVLSDEFDRVVAATVSRDEFTPSASDDLSTENFSIIKQGISLPGANPSTGDSTSRGFYFWGTAAHALRLGNYPAANYALLSDIQGLINAPIGFAIPQDQGILIGAAQVLRVHADSGLNEGYITNQTGGNIRFRVFDGITTSTSMSIEKSSILPEGNNIVNLGSNSQRFAQFWTNTSTAVVSVANTFTAVRGFIGTLTGTLLGNVSTAIGSSAFNAVTANSLTVGSLSVTTGLSGAVSGNVTTSLIQATGGTDASSGQIRGAWSLVGSSTLRATYADLAERYHADAIYDGGTVLVLGGEFEVTTTYLRADSTMAGIVSTAPAYMMNSEAGENETHPYIALKGRVPCKVIGPIKKGQRLVTSTTRGYAEAFQAGDDPDAVIGKALEDFDSTGPGLIEVKV
jgi:hypothetical protein